MCDITSSYHYFKCDSTNSREVLLYLLSTSKWLPNNLSRMIDYLFYLLVLSFDWSKFWSIFERWCHHCLFFPTSIFLLQMQSRKYWYRYYYLREACVQLKIENCYPLSKNIIKIFLSLEVIMSSRNDPSR